MDFTTPGYEDLELSTQIIIGEALARGYAVDVLDRTDNFIRIRGKGKIEYVKQATRTSRDSYIAPLIMENKSVTKAILAETGIRVPAGEECSRADAGVFPRWKGKAIVIKPKSTNFGKGVHILHPPFAEGDWNAAVDDALAYDDRILVEEFQAGREYRFLVVGDEVPAVLRRVPANVTGDGKMAIRELVERKNRNPLRGTGYTAPLEKIRLGGVETGFLALQGLTADSVPEAGRQVFLRENSNISTGGDSIDCTDDVHPSYKAIAAASAKAVGARISGVDIIADDVSRRADGENYAVIELNFNPAIHIHDFPWQGKNRRLEEHVFRLLGL